MKGILDFMNTPEGQGLLAASFAGMAGARRGQPVNTLGAAGLGGLLGYTRAQENQQQAGLRDLQLKRYTRDDEEYERKKAAIDAMPEQYRALATLDPRAAAERAYPAPEKPQLVTVNGPNGPMQRWVRPGEAEGTDVGATYEPKLDPRVRTADTEDAVARARALLPFDLQKASAGATRIENYPNPIPVTGPDGKVRMVQFGSKGAKVETPYAPPPANNPTQEGERKAATLLKRLEGSQAQLSAALEQNPDAATPGLFASGLRAVGADALANKAATSSERQRIEAAQLDMLDAALTLGTGAAYTREQLEGYRQSYFPQIGDTDATIKDKQDRLTNVIDAAHIAAGRAVPPKNPKGDNLAPQDKEAMKWLSENPNHPRAAEVKRKLGL